MTDHISKADAAWAVRRVLENVDPEMCDLAVDAINALPASPVDGEVESRLGEAIYAIKNAIEPDRSKVPSKRDFDYEDFCVWAEMWLAKAESALTRKDEG